MILIFQKKVGFDFFQDIYRFLNAQAVAFARSPRATKKRASFGWAQPGREFPWVHAQLGAFLFSSPPGGPLAAGRGSVCLGLAWLPGAPVTSARWRRAPSGAGECPKDLAIAEIVFSNLRLVQIFHFSKSIISCI